MQLRTLTWPDVEAYLEKSDALLMPIGSHEQHGPNGMIGTDIICPETIAAAVSRRMGILVGPSIPVGQAQHHLGFAGTVSLRPTTLIAVVRDYVQSLAHHGFRRFLFLNGHGGNLPTVRAAFSEIWADRSLGRSETELDLRVMNWYLSPRVVELSKELFPGVEGHHATPSEVSLTFHAHPKEARIVERLEPEVAPFGDVTDARAYRERFPDGRIGSNPALASAEHGARFLQAATEDVLDALRELGVATDPSKA